MSPDGDRLAFTGSDSEGTVHLFVRSLADGLTERIEGSSGAFAPFWSPDGQNVGFNTGSELRTLALADRKVRRVGETEADSGTWSEQGQILAASPGGRLIRIDAETGEGAELVLDVPAGVHAQSAHFLPDGEHFLFLGVDYASDDRQ